MGLETIREVLGQLQADAEPAQLWNSLESEVQAASGDGELPQLLTAARHAHGRRGEWEAASRLLSLELTCTANDDGKLELLVELARVQQHELLDEARSMEAYKQALSLTPDDELLLAAVAESSERAGKWQEMVAAYIAEADGAADDVYKASMLMRAAEMEWRFAKDERDDERVLGWLAQAAEADPKNTTVLQMLERIYIHGGKYEALPSVLERWCAATEEASQAVAAALRLGRLQSKQLNDVEAAARAYEVALEADPAESEAIAWLVRYYSDAANWDRLVSVYERELSQYELNRGERVGDMLQIAMLHYKKRESLSDAFAWFERVRVLEPTNSAMLDFYREYCSGAGHEGLLLDVLQQAQRVLPSGDEKNTVTAEIAKLAEGQQDAQQAIEQYKALLRQDPGNAEAREALKSLYRKTQGYNQLVDLLQHELEQVPEDKKTEKLAILSEVASVYRDHVPNETSLVSALNQILKIDDQRVETIRELILLYARLERWRDLLTNQQRLAVLSDDPEERAELLRDSGRRWLDQFSNVQNATLAFESLIELVPDDREARDILANLYKKRRAWPALYKLYESQLASLTGPQRIAVMKEMAELAADRLGNRETAAALYKQILEVEPTNLAVLDALEKQAERAKDWATLAQALEHRMDVPMEDPARVAVLQKLGGVYQDQLKDHTRSVSAWQRVLELQAGHPRAMRVLRDSYLATMDFEALEALYADQQDYEGLAEVLSNTADKAPDLRTKIDLSYRAARIFEENLQKPERAFRCYERVMASDPMDTRAAQALLPLYERDEKWARLPALYELLIGDTKSKDAKLDLYKRLTDVTANRLNDKKGAVAFARSAYELDPERADALEFFEQACALGDNWEAYVEAIEARLSLHRQSVAPPPKGGRRRRRGKGQSSEPQSGEDALTAETVQRLELKLAQKYGSKLGRLDDAVAVYKRLLESQPDHEAAGGELEVLLRAASKHDDFRWLLGLRLENATSDDDELRLMKDWAQLEELTFGDPARSAELFRRVLESHPSDTTALTQLPRLLEGLGEFEAASEVIIQHRDLAEGELRARLEAELAVLYAGKLGRPMDSLDASIRAIELGSEAEAVIEILRQLSEQDDTKVRAAEVLAEVYRRSGESRREADALLSLLQSESESARRLELYVRAVGVFEQLDSFGSAFETMVKACREFPQRLELWDRANVLSEQASRPTELAEAYREVLRGELADATQRDLCERAAVLHTDQLGDPAGATPYLEKVLVLDPGDQEAYIQLKQILTSNQRWGELQMLYERTAAAVDEPSTKIEILAEVAMVCEEFIEDSKTALAYYEQILDLDPEQEAALEALDRLYVQHDRTEALEQLLVTRLTLESDAARVIEFRLRLAELFLDKQHEPEKALPHLSEVLTHELSNVRARDLTERILEIGSVRGRAAEILEALYEGRDEIRDLVRVLDVRVDVLRQQTPKPSTYDEDLKELLRRVADLRDERLRDDAGALETLSQYVPLAPNDDAAREKLVEICHRLGAQESVAAVLKQAGEQAEDSVLQGEIWLQSADLYNLSLGQFEAAEALYGKVLSVCADSGHLAQPAARALEVIFAQRDDSEALVGNLRIQIDLVDDADERIALLGRVARLSEAKLDDVAGAIACWKERLQQNGADTEALGSLDRLYEGAEEWSELVVILELRRAQLDDSAERAKLFGRSAQILARKLDDKPGAVDAYRAMLDEGAADVGILKALEELLTELSRWDELAEVYEKHLEQTETNTERHSLLVALGDLRRSRLDDVPRALERYREVVGVEPNHAGARAALGELLASDNAAYQRQAAEVLLPLHEGASEYADLLAVLRIAIETAELHDDKLSALKQAIDVSDRLLEKPEEAFKLVCQAVGVASGHSELAPWLEELERLATATGERARQVELLREVVDGIFDGDVQFAVVSRIAVLARDALDDKQLSLTFFQRAVELRSDADEALAALQALYTESEQYEPLRRVLEQRSELLDSGAELKALLFLRARLLESKLSAPDQAAVVFEAIIELDFDSEAVAGLTDLYARENRWEDLLDLQARQRGLAGADSAGLRVSMAKVAAEKLGDVFRAFEHLEAALEEESQHAGAIAELERLMTAEGEPQQHAHAARLLEPIYLARADYDQVMHTLNARLEYAEAADERRGLLVSLAQLYEEQKEDYALAFETTARLLKEDLDEGNTIAELERLARVADKAQRLAEVYAEQLEDLSGDESKSAHMAQRAGELYRDGNEPEVSLRFFRKALEFRPESVELFTAIDALLEQLEQHQDRVELYRETLNTRADSSERIALLHTVASLQAEKLGQKQGAISTYVEVLELDEQDGVSLDALGRLYFETERYEDLYELVLRRAEAAPDQKRASSYRLALAKLCKNELRDDQRAIDQLEEIVGVDPAHTEAVEELSAYRQDVEQCHRVVDILLPLYEAADDWRRMINLNEDRFRLAELATEKVSVLRETASLWENRGAEPKKALKALAEAIRLEPEDDEVRAEYQRIIEFTESWDMLATLYAALLKERPDVLCARDMWAALARCHDESRDDPRAALEAYGSLHKLDQDDLEVVERMEALATLLSDWQVLDSVLEAKANLVLEEADRASIMRRVAEGRRDMLSRPEGAIEAYERALEFEPDSAFTVDCLIELYEAASNPERLCELYERRVDLTAPQDVEIQFANLMLAATCHREKFSDHPRAIDLLNRALEVRPDDAGTLEQLGQLYAVEQQWPELMDNLATRAALAEELELRASLHCQRGDVLCDKMESFEEALDAYELVLQELPNEEQAQRQVRKIGEEHEELRERMASILLPALQNSAAHESVVEVLELRLTSESEPFARSQTLRLIARTLEGPVGAAVRAHAALLRAMAEVSEDDSIHSELERLSEAEGQWAAYADALADRADNLFDAELAKDLFVRLGVIAENKLGSGARAIDSYCKAIEQVGDNPELLGTLDRLYVSVEQWPALLEILERRIALVDSDAERAELYQRLGLLQIDRFEEVGQGLESLRSALELDPGLQGASSKLEELTVRRDLFDDAADVLEVVYRTRGDVEKLTALSEKRVEYADSPAERLDMRKNLARVLEEEMADTPNAQRVLQQGLVEDPGDEGLLIELERLAQVTGDWASAASALGAALTQNEDLPAETGRELCVRMAGWYADNADDSALAEEALKRAFEYDKTSEDALIRLEALQSLPGRESAKVHTLRQRAQLQYDEQVREELYREAKEVADSVQEIALSESVVRELLEHDDANTWALHQLSEQREAAGDHEETFKLLLRLAEATFDGQEVSRLRHRAASMALSKLNEPTRAVELYERLFEDEVEDTESSAALRKLYLELERFEDLAGLLARLAELAESVSERTQIRLELATLQQTRFKSAESAIAVLSEVLLDDPESTEAVVQLSRLYEENDRDADLAELLTVQIEAAENRGDGEGVVRFEMRLAEVCETKLSNVVRAAETYLRILERDSTYLPALEALTRLYTESGDQEAAIDMLVRRVELTSGDEQLALTKTLAHAHQSNEAREEALGSWEFALELRADDTEVRDELRRIYGEVESWNKLGELIAGDAELREEATEQAKILSEAAGVFAEHAGDLRRAAELLEAATERTPDDRALLLRLCDIYSECDRGADAVRALEQIVESFGGRRSKELGDIHRRLSDAYRAQGNDAKAIEELDRAFRIEPGNIAVLKALGVLSLDNNDLKRAQQMFRALLLQKLGADSPITKAEVFYRLGVVHQRLDELPRAKQMLERACQTDPNLQEAQELLAELNQ